MMTKTTDRASELAKRLMEQYAALGSWRRVAEHYPGVTFQTLNRIALAGGEWLPKDKHILIALGIVKAPRQKTKYEKRIDRKISKMARDMKEPERYKDPDIPEAEKRMKGTKP